jgi:hypothetical protein
MEQGHAERDEARQNRIVAHIFLIIRTNLRRPRNFAGLVQPSQPRRASTARRNLLRGGPSTAQVTRRSSDPARASRAPAQAVDRLRGNSIGFIATSNRISAGAAIMTALTRSLVPLDGDQILSPPDKGP